MASSQHCLFFALLFLSIAFTYSDTAKFLSYGVLQAGKHPGRTLSEGTKNCPIDLKRQNYTILTSQCKGPKYPAKECCNALLEFCCRFVDDLNNVENNCAETMFGYIDEHGKYPPNLFGESCKEGIEGLSCQKTLLDQEKKGLLIEP